MSDEWNPNMKRRLIKNKSDRKRRKVSAIRQQHNLSANRARDLDEEKRRRDRENQRVARQRNPQRRAAAHRARDLDEEKRRRKTENLRVARQRDPERRTYNFHRSSIKYKLLKLNNRHWYATDKGLKFSVETIPKIGRYQSNLYRRDRPNIIA